MDIILSTHQIENIKKVGMLNFQERILELVDTNISILDQMNYISIVIHNLKTFIIERMPDSKRGIEIDDTIKRLSRLYIMIDHLITERNKKYKVHLPDHIDNNILSEILHPSMLQSYYIEDTDSEKVHNQKSIFTIQDKSCIGISCLRTHVNSSITTWFMIPESVMLFSEYEKIYKSKFQKQENHKKLTKYHITKEYLDSSKERDILLRCPYDDYITIINFITDICTHVDIESIWITLYRVKPKHSKIVEALKEAAQLKKHVYVFVEINARGDEKNNQIVCKELIKAGCHVKTNYFGYKVHGKAFVATDKNGKIYAHVGTGNYNEKTATQYTDTHMITTDSNKTKDLLKVITSLFEKKIYKVSKININAKVLSAPFNLRYQIIALICNEIQKKENGRIYIKVNNFYDPEVSNLIYEAADNHVDVRIICRTTCNLQSYNTLKIRSKVGKYLEHDRLFIFGDRAFISSSDLLFRNISKRFELLCEAPLKNIYQYFLNVWNSEDIFEMKNMNEWELSSRKKE